MWPLLFRLFYNNDETSVYCFIGADVEKVGGGATEFRYPSYVQHIMGWDIFSLF